MSPVCAWPPVPLPPELSDRVVVSRGVPDEPLRQCEDPFRHAQGQREAAAPGAEVRLIQADRVVRLEPDVDQLRPLQHPPAVTLTGQRDRSLLGMGPAPVMLPGLPELAVAVVFPGPAGSRPLSAPPRTWSARGNPWPARRPARPSAPRCGCRAVSAAAIAAL